MALYSAKTMQFVRAPDENVFIAPFNLIELFFLVIPLEWWMSTHRYERLNNYVMGVIYSPLLLVTSWFETRAAAEVRSNRSRGEEDDDTIEEWEQLDGEIDFEAEGWAKKVESGRPNVEIEAAVLEVRQLREIVEDMQKTIEKTSTQRDDGSS